MFINEYVIFKLEEEESIMLNDSTIEVYMNNVVIECSNHMKEISHLYNHTIQRLNPLHLISKDNLLTVTLYSSYIEELKMDVDSYGRIRTTINIIADHIETFEKTNSFLRKPKIEKIMKKINV